MHKFFKTNIVITVLLTITLTISLFIVGCQSAEDSPVVKISFGKIRGEIIDGVSIFRGIPYGKATRFMSPVKPENWKGIRDVTENGPRAIQKPGGQMLASDPLSHYFGGGRAAQLRIDKESDSEECLVLNVVTPRADNKKRPVMVYIHGGGFITGSGIMVIAGTRMVNEQNVVLVGINHRLNVFGYLNLSGISSDYSKSANVGMQDLVASLEWVRDEITNFGGDPDNVTIFGASGGGAKISVLMAMPSAKGLFHKAIIESGSRLRINTLEDATVSAKQLLNKLKIPENEIEQLRNISAEELLAASFGNNFSPALDGDIIPQHPFDPNAPEIIANVPMIIGSCQDETTFFTALDTAFDNVDLDSRIAALLNGCDKDKVINTYSKNRPGASLKDIYLAISSDQRFRKDAIKQAELKAEQGKELAFMYYFCWDTPIIINSMNINAFHTAELPLEQRIVYYTESEGLSKLISAYWAAFARTGNPNKDGLDNWPSYTKDQRSTMIFNLQSKVVNDPDREERLLFENF